MQTAKGKLLSMIKARKEATNAIRMNHNRGKMYLERAKLSNKLNMKQYVYSDFQRAIKHNPENLSAYLMILDTFLYKFQSAHWAQMICRRLYEQFDDVKLDPIKKELTQFNIAINDRLRDETTDALLYYPRVINDADVSVESNKQQFDLLLDGNHSVEVKGCDNGGSRGLFTKVAVSKGSVVLSEDPLVSVPLRENRCIRCGHLVPPGQQVSEFCKGRYESMKSKRFCGDTLSDLRSYLARSSSDLPKLTLLYMKLTAMQVEMDDSDRLRSVYHVFPWLNLLVPSKVFSADESDESARVEIDLVPFINLYDIITERMQYTEDDFAQSDFETFEKVILTMINYNFSSDRKDIYFIGKGLSFANHSCEPNVKHVIEGNKIQLIATRDIEAGDELTIAYFNPDTSDHETSFMYGFACKQTCDCT